MLIPGLEFNINQFKKNYAQNEWRLVHNSITDAAKLVKPGIPIIGIY